MWTSGWNVVYLWVTLFFLFLCVAMALVLLPPRFFLSFSLFELLSFPLPFPLRSLVRYFCVWPSYKLEKCPFKHDKVPFALSSNCLQCRRLFSLTKTTQLTTDRFHPLPFPKTETKTTLDCSTLDDKPIPAFPVEHFTVWLQLLDSD